MVWKETLGYLRKKEKIKTCVEHTNLGVGGRRLRELMFSLDFSEMRSFIGTADK